MKELIQIYDECFTSSPRNVLEIGSRDAEDAKKLAEHYGIPCEKVYIVEPHPHCISYIRKNHSCYNLYEYAISDVEGTAKFNAIFHEDLGTLGMSSLLNRTHGNISENWIDVKTITGKTLFDQIGENEYDLVKIDVEGYSYEVLKSFEDQINKIKIMHLEAEHYPFWIGQKLYSEVSDLLLSKGFEERYRFDYNYTEKQVQSDVIWVKK